MTIDIVLRFFSEILYKTSLSKLKFYRYLADLFRLWSNLLVNNNKVKIDTTDFNLISSRCYQLSNEEHSKPDLIYQSLGC